MNRRKQMKAFELESRLILACMLACAISIIVDLIIDKDLWSVFFACLAGEFLIIAHGLLLRRWGAEIEEMKNESSRIA